MTERVETPEKLTTTLKTGFLAAGLITAPFAFADFALRPEVLTSAFLDPLHAAGAYLFYWLTIWGLYALLEVAFLIPLSAGGREGVRSAVVSILRMGIGLAFIRYATPDIPMGGLILAVVTPAYAYSLGLGTRSKRGGSGIGYVLAIGGMMVFALGAAYYWAANYASWSFGHSGAWHWGAFALLLLPAIFVALRPNKSIHTWLWTAGLASLGVILFLTLTPTLPKNTVVGGSRESRLKIVLISIDTLRADALSCYASTVDATPNIDSLAEDGWLFREAYSGGSWTIPSMTSLFTGASPLVHGVSLPVQDAALPTVADYFADAGFETIGLFGNPVLRNEADVLNPALRAHFDFYQGFRHLRVFANTRFGLTRSGPMYARAFGFDLLQGANTEGIADLAVERIHNLGDEPALLWVHFFDPHWPYAPRPDLVPSEPARSHQVGSIFDLAHQVRLGTRSLDGDDRRRVRALYQAEVRYIDETVGRILDSLRKTGAYDDALVVLTSDHGEEFWEHGKYGHGHSLHRELLHIPLIVKLPGDAKGRTVETPVENRSILPTLLEIANLPHESKAYWAPSLVSLMKQTGDSEEAAPILSSGVELFENEAAIRIGELRYIRKLYSGEESLFDLSIDPGEMRSILYERPEDAERMRRALDHHLGESQRIRESMGLSDETVEPFDEETLKRLKSLGYL